MREKVFNRYQQVEITEGLRQKLNVACYAKPEFLAVQMRQIRMGLAEHLPMEKYAIPEYDWFQLEEIRLGLENKVDVSKYDSPDISYELMRQIRLGLESGIDMSSGTRFAAGVLRQLRLATLKGVDIRKFIQAGYEEEQLIPIRLAIQNGIDIAPFISITHRGSAINEISLGLQKGLDVSVYCSDEYNWQQMKEIRLGLENRIDVSCYSNPLYSWRQMEQLRLGMLERLPVEEYKSLMYTSREMQKKRLALLEQRKPKMNTSDEIGNTQESGTVQYTDALLMIKDDWMEASILLTGSKEDFNKDKIYEMLAENGITTGICKENIEAIEANYEPGAIIVVAKGENPGKGKDGWYEYLFDTDIKQTPVVLENGSVDYKHVKWFEIVKKNQKIAYYHSAEAGREGTRIDGQKIQGEFGNELPSIEGSGIIRLKDQKTYASLIDGKIELRDGKLIVSDMLILDDVTRVNGNIDFQGSVYVRGNVQQGVNIKATKDIIVDGFIEASELDAGGDILLKNGNNAGGNGMIRAKGSVMGRFFENTNIVAGGDIKANYCLNCTLKADENIVIAGKVGRIAGGKYTAGCSISSFYIGNENGLSTILKVGKKETFMKQKKELENRKDSVLKELTMLTNAYAEFQNKLPVEVRNTNKMYLKLEDAIHTKDIEQKEIESEIELFSQEIKKSANAHIHVAGTIYEGVYVDIDGAKWNAKAIQNITIKNIKSRIKLIGNS